MFSTLPETHRALANCPSDKANNEGKLHVSKDSLPGPPRHFMQNKELSHPKKKRTLKLIMPSSQQVQPLANFQNVFPQPFVR